MPMDLYYTTGSGPCRAVGLVVKLLGLPVNIKHLNLRNQEQLTAEFLKINPQHTVPTLVDDDFIIWDSHAIITYLAEKYGKDESIYPKDPKQRALIHQKLFFDIGTLVQRYADYYYPIFFAKASPDPEKYKKVEEALKLLDGFLEGHEYVVGNNLTVADISLVSTIASYDVTNFDLSPYKNVTRWYDNLKVVLPEFEEVSGKEMLTKLFEQYKK